MLISAIGVVVFGYFEPLLVNLKLSYVGTSTLLFGNSLLYVSSSVQIGHGTSCVYNEILALLEDLACCRAIERVSQLLQALYLWQASAMPQCASFLSLTLQCRV